MPTFIDGTSYLSHAPTSAPASEPVTLAEAKAHSNIAHAEDDTTITSQLIAARDYIEALIKGPLIQRTYRLRLDRFPASNAIALPGYPLVSVTAVRYVDSANAIQVMSNTAYAADSDSSPARCTLARGSAWPSVGVVAGLYGVEVEYVAGYANAAAVPFPLKQAVLLMFGHWYDNTRETATAENLKEAPHAAEVLCRTFVRTRWAV
jgi:uncharacterized phiE125 gp8 family phage protein